MGVGGRQGKRKGFHLAFTSSILSDDESKNGYPSEKLVCVINDTRRNGSIQIKDRLKSRTLAGLPAHGEHIQYQSVA